LAVKPERGSAVQPEHGPAAEPGHEGELTVRPEDLGRLFLERANAGDVEGLVALYETGAVLAFPPGGLATGHEQIRTVYAELLADRLSFSSLGQPAAIINGDLALTSTRLPDGGATVEVARRQPDGTWRWVIDQPALPA
jgi:ketosteroid isomerase-like protein